MMTTNTTPKRGGIYCRISLRKKNDDIKNPIPKVEAQEALCRTLADAHGIDVVAIYTDDGVSASTFKDRAGWADLLADVEAGRLDVVLAQAEDRFTRQPMEKETLMLACAARGVTFLTVNDGHTDPATADGEFFATLRAALGRMESRKMGTRKKQMNAERRAKGMIPRGGPRPFGWQQDRLALDEREAPLLREAFMDLIAGTRTPSAIATAWNKAGVLTTRGGRWDIPKVQAILKRPRNAGLMFYEGKPVPSEGDKPMLPTWQPIIDEDTWRTALAILHDPARRLTKRHIPKYLTASMASCGTCGAPLRSAKNHARSIYRCATADGFGKKTGGRHVAILTETLDRIVTDEVLSAVVLAGTAALTDPHQQALNSLHQRLSAVRKAEADLLDLLGTEAFCAAEIAGKKRSLHAEAQEIEASIADMAQRDARAALLADVQLSLWWGRDQQVSLMGAAKVRGQIRERFEGLPLEQRRALVRGLVDITVYPGVGARRVIVRHLVTTELNDEAGPTYEELA